MCGLWNNRKYTALVTMVPAKMNNFSAFRVIILLHTVPPVPLVYSTTHLPTPIYIIVKPWADSNCTTDLTTYGQTAMEFN